MRNIFKLPSGLSVRVTAFVSALFLSLLCGIFYNLWKYEVERIELEEGGWHSRLIGEFSTEKLETIKNFANIRDVVLEKDERHETESAVDLYFSDLGAVFTDTPRIAEQLKVPQENIIYHYSLLSMYLVRGPGDPSPRLIFPLFLLITLSAAFTLILILHNSFAVSMNARIHQLGIFSSVGATPGQIWRCLLQEASSLCAMPIAVGNLLGVAGSAGVVRLTNVLLERHLPGRHKSVFGYHPLLLALSLLVTLLTVWISAWLPARKLSRLTPLEAIRTAGEYQLKRRKRPSLLALLFGVEGELAGNALKAQRKVLRTATLSFLFSFLAFATMQCFFTLSGISTRETYFERYQDVWDVMVTLKGTDADGFAETDDVRALEGVESAIVYQKAAAKRLLLTEELSGEMMSLGGFAQAPASDVTPLEDGWLVNAPIVVLDDASFSAYCGQLGIPPRLDGTVILNQIRDVTNPDFRHPVFLPYLKEPKEDVDAVSVLRPTDGTETAFGQNSAAYDADKEAEAAVSALAYGADDEVEAAVPVLAYAQEVPALREEYATLDYYELVHFLPVSLWKELKGRLGGAEADSYLCVRGREDATLEELDALQEKIDRLLSGKYEIESENRIREYEANGKMIQGMLSFFGMFCVLLAIIGVGSVFSNTLGFVRQRRREFARYMSVGLTPGQLRKMFFTEALAVAGRPFLIGIPLVAFAVGCMLRASYVEVGVFMAEAPLLPILLFLLAVSGSVALAYYLAWRNVRRISLAEVLRDDTMM